MASTTFVDQKTVITADWANDVNNVAYNTVPALATSAGSSGVGFIQAGTGAKATTLQEQGRVVVNVFQFMTAEQIADVKANTAASNLSGALDVTSAIQAAISYAATRSLVGGIVYLPPGSYKITSTIYTYGAGASGQVALVGDGPYSTRLFPSGDFTVVNDVSSYGETGGFSIEWPLTAKAAIPATRVGVEFAGANWQCSYTTKRKITVQYAYRGFVLNDWTGQPYGTIYLVKLFALTAFRCADWGIYLNSKVGSTTTILEQCYVRGDDSTGTPSGKGIFINNIDDVLMLNCAVDQCVDNWMRVQNASTLTANSLAFEANKILSAGQVAVNINSTSAAIYGVKTISCTYDTGGNARVISLGGNTYSLALQGYSEQGANIVAGTSRYKVVTNAAASHIFILDRSVLPQDVLDNGWFANVSYEGQRRSSTGIVPNYGTWVRGDYVKNGAPAVGQPKGWYCTSAGSPGTWTSEGNL